jgi:hypothetical protein
MLDTTLLWQQLLRLSQFFTKNPAPMNRQYSHIEFVGLFLDYVNRLPSAHSQSA